MSKTAVQTVYWSQQCNISHNGKFHLSTYGHTKRHHSNDITLHSVKATGNSLKKRPLRDNNTPDFAQ